GPPAAPCPGGNQPTRCGSGLQPDAADAQPRRPARRRNSQNQGKRRLPPPLREVTAGRCADLNQGPGSFPPGKQGTRPLVRFPSEPMDCFQTVCPPSRNPFPAGGASLLCDETKRRPVAVFGSGFVGIVLA